MFGKTSSGNIIFYEIFGGWAVVALLFALTGNMDVIGEVTSRDLALITLLAGVFTAYPMFESVRLMKYISPFTLMRDLWVKSKHPTPCIERSIITSSESV